MSERTTAEAALKAGGSWLTLFGILLVIFGFVSIAAPLITGVAVALTVGALVTVTGALQLMSAFRSHSWGKGALGVLMGVISLVAGVLMIAHPLAGLGFLTLLLVSYFLVAGAFEIAEAFSLRDAPGWGWRLASGAVSVVLALLIWQQWPVSGAWAVGLLVGIRILFCGWTTLMVGGAARGMARAASHG